MHRLRGKRVLVTGSYGFIGVHLCAALSGVGAVVIGVSRRAKSSEVQGMELHEIDLVDGEAIRRLIENTCPEFVVHLAGVRQRTVELGEFGPSYKVNLLGTLNLVEACRAVGRPSRFVSLGTCEEYGGGTAPFDETQREAPVSAYGVSKLAVTHLLEAVSRTYQFPAVVLRPTNVYGPGQGEEMFVPALVSALLSGREFAMTAGEQTRDYVYVDDLVDAIVSALELQVPCGSVINIGSGIPVRIKEMALLAARSIGPTAPKLLRLGSRDYRPGEPMDYWASNDRASRLLGWRPRVSLEEGIARTVAGIRRTCRFD